MTLEEPTCSPLDHLESSSRAFLGHLEGTWKTLGVHLELLWSQLRGNSESKVRLECRLAVKVPTLRIDRKLRYGMKVGSPKMEPQTAASAKTGLENT